MLKIGGISTIFYTLSTVTSSALQGIDKMKLPVRHAAISLAVHVVLTFVLLRFTNLGIYGLVIGNATFPVLIFILNFRCLKKYIGYKQESVKTFVVLGIIAILMGVCCRATYRILYTITSSNIVAVAAAVLVAVCVYFGTVNAYKKGKR